MAGGSPLFPIYFLPCFVVIWLYVGLYYCVSACRYHRRCELNRVWMRVMGIAICWTVWNRSMHYDVVRINYRVAGCIIVHALGLVVHYLQSFC